MNRQTIDYGIDLGTTNSAIVRVDSGTVRVIKSKDNQKDTTPSAVAFNKKGTQYTGESAYASFRSESTKSLKTSTKKNAFIEFKRTMGTDETYSSQFTGLDYSSEHLSSEVLKYLKGYVDDESVGSAVITIPAAYTQNQIDAVRRAATLAGLDYVQTLQEPIAAAMAYGVENKGHDGFWLVFDFGGGTFDAALVKVDEGIIQVIDSSGDNYLGGKDLDYAIVDQIIIPHIEDNYSIDKILSDGDKKNSLRSSLKFDAEIIKNQLSFTDEYELYIEEGNFTEDDEGEDIEIELTVTKADLLPVLSPVFQRAIDLSKELLKRNNLDNDHLRSLVLVGGPTLSPILREMLDEQICTPDTSVDPMTVVARGAAIYASTLSLPKSVVDSNRDRTKVQLDVEYDASTVDDSLFVSVKVLESKTDGVLPDSLMVQLSRGDRAFVSEKVEVDSIGDVIDVLLEKGTTNRFEVLLYDGLGNRVECEPESFNIIQGSVLGGMPLPHHWGIEVLKPETNDLRFQPLIGLAKNATLPAQGTPKNKLKTQKDIRPGVYDDFLKVPLYQGEDDAEGTRAVNNEHVYDAIVRGTDLPALLPAGSEIELTVSLDAEQKASLEVFIPYLDFSHEIKVPTNNVQSVDVDWLKSEFDKADIELSELGASSELGDRLAKAKQELDQNADDTDAQMKARNQLREVMREVDNMKASDHWPAMERKLKSEFKRLEDANHDLGNSETTHLVNEMRSELSATLASQDLKAGHHMLKVIKDLFFNLTSLYQYMGFIRSFNEHFASYDWSDRVEARALINQGVQLIAQKADEQEIGSVVFKLFDLLPENERSQVDDSVLVG